MKFLIFRTDRIGDFIVTAILIKSIKQKYNNAKITIISSNKNLNFISKFNLVDNVFLYPENLKDKYLLIKKLNKLNFDYLLVVDGKKRSFFLSLFIKSKKKILTFTKPIFNFFNFFKNIEVIYDNEIDYNKIDIIKKNLSILKCDFSQNDLNIFDNQNIFSKFEPFINLINNNYIILHLDEKWIYNEYIKKYQNIEPDKGHLEIFINKLINFTNKNLIITTGVKSNKLTECVKIKSSIVNENISFLKKDNFKIIICENIDIFDLIFLISKSSLLITCHGSPTHIASSFNVKTIDIIDNSEIDLFNKYVAHLRNYNQICRQSFKDLADEIYKLLT